VKATFLRRVQETEGVWSFWFSRPASFVYTAGDYTELSLEGVRTDHRRWFSLASAPSETDLRITTWVNSQSSPFKHQLLKLNAGDPVDFAPPMGNFNAPIRPDKLLFIAGGIGIAPFRSILVEQTAVPIGHDIVLFYIAQAKRHLFLPEIKRSDVSFLKQISNVSRLKLDEINRQVPDVSERLVYLAGPQPMMTQFYEEFLSGGHKRWRLRLCYFPGYQSI
jgi:ferredoxin-NADP reductase